MYDYAAERHAVDTHLLAGGQVFGQLDLGKVSLADGLEQLVLADVRLRVGPRPMRLLKHTEREGSCQSYVTQETTGSHETTD